MNEDNGNSIWGLIILMLVGLVVVAWQRGAYLP